MTPPLLAGVSVLAAEQMHALPHGTQLLALMGAEVIKVEPPGGESGRTGLPALLDRDGRRTGSTFIRNNLAKSSIVTDLKQPAGRELFLRLAGTVDAVVENFRPGTAAKLGIGYEAVHAVNARAVYVSICGFGNRTDPPSPYRDWPAYAPIVEGMAGLYEYSRRVDDPPRPALAGALGDTAAGLYAVIGLLAALHERERTGVGRYVDVAMYDAMIAIADVVHLDSMGVVPSRALEGIGIITAFRARNGWFTVEVVREPHFVRLAEGGVVAGPVNSAADIRADPHVVARRLVHELDADSSTVAVVGNPIDFGGSPADGAEPAPWPLLGADTDRVLSERLGLTPEELSDLRARGVVA